MAIKVEHTSDRQTQRRQEGPLLTLRWWGTDGKKYSESVGRVGQVTKNEAERARRTKEQEIGGGKISRNRPRRMTLAEFIEYDLEAVRGVLKRNTIESIKHSSAHAIAAWGGDTGLSSLKAARRASQGVPAR